MDRVSSGEFFFFQLNVLHTELAKRLADAMVLPIVQFREKDLTGIVTKFTAFTFKILFNSNSNSSCINVFRNVWIIEKCLSFWVGQFSKLSSTPRPQCSWLTLTRSQANKTRVEKQIAVRQELRGRAVWGGAQRQACFQGECWERLLEEPSPTWESSGV